MSEMIKRVARAICKSNFLNGGIEDDDGWDDAPLNLRNRYLENARAAIEAMREPTEAMIKAFDDYDPPAWGQYNGPVPEEAWRKMIDAALTPPLDTQSAGAHKARSPIPAGATTD